eukprot:231201_1
MQTRPPRAAKERTRAAKERKMISHTDEFVQIYQADIPDIKNAFVRAQTGDDEKLTGDDDNGIVIIASVPMMDNDNGDYMSWVLFANEKRILVVKSFHLFVDDKEYYQHTKAQRENYPHLIRCIKVFRKWRIVNNQSSVGDGDERAMDIDPSNGVAEAAVKSFALKVFRQRLFFMSVRFWNRLRLKNWEKPCKSEEHISNWIWEKCAYVFERMSTSYSQSRSKCIYEGINPTQFYALMGIEFCVRECDDKSRYFMANIECSFSWTSQMFIVKWVTLHKSAKGTLSGKRPVA